MKIKKLILKNFRAFLDVEIPFNDGLNTIIGKNDIGKSTILEALEIFFNNDRVKIDTDDLSRDAKSSEIIIGICFEVIKNKEYLIDVDVKTRLDQEYLLNQEGYLEIHKVWDCSKKSLTTKSLSTYIICQYPQEYKDNPLPILKIKELRKKVEEINLINEVKDKRVSSCFRKVLYDNCDSQNLTNAKIPVDKEDAKKIYDSLSKDFPFYALFQSDRPNKDTDKEFQDPLKIITKQAILELESELNSVVEQIQRKALEKGEKTIEKLKEMNPEVADSLTPNVKNKNWDTLFSFSFTGDNDIPLNKRGSGVRRLILLNFFRAEVEEKATSGKAIIYAIEEPETSQHPNHQIMLMNALIEIANHDRYQVIITTHSPEIAKLCYKENLILLERDEDSLPVCITDIDYKIKRIKETLGILPYLTKVVVCVEGENDIKFLRNINKIPELELIVDLNEISIIPMTGENLRYWIDRNYLRESNVIEFHIYDNDKDEYKDMVQKMNDEDSNRIGVITKKLQMENYIHWDLIEKYYASERLSFTDEEKNDWDTIDIPKIIADRTKYKEQTIKRHLNGNVAKNMTKELLEEINGFEEIKGWFTAIKEKIEESGM